MSIRIILKKYLDKYHSDYRWKIIYYTNELQEVYNTESFRGAMKYWLNYRRSKENFVIYGAPMHEYFYGKFNDEKYHEFCYTKLKYDPVFLGLVGSEKELQDYFDAIGQPKEGEL